MNQKKIMGLTTTHYLIIGWALPIENVWKYCKESKNNIEEDEEPEQEEEEEECCYPDMICRCLLSKIPVPEKFRLEMVSPYHYCEPNECNVYLTCNTDDNISCEDMKSIILNTSFEEARKFAHLLGGEGDERVISCADLC